MKFVVLVFGLLMFSLGSYAQQEKIETLIKNKALNLNEVESFLEKNQLAPLNCEELAINEEILERNQELNKDDSPYKKHVFNVYFHVLNENGGNRAFPIEEDDLKNAVTILNRHFNQFKIYFKYNGYGDINSTWRSVVYVYGKRTFPGLIKYAKDIGKYKEGSLNIFVAGTIRTSQYSSNIPGLAQKLGINSVIDDESLLTSTLPHEIAHNFFLHHTYHNWSSSNCESVKANDLVDDTAPSVFFKASEVQNCSTYLGDKNTGRCGMDYTNVPANNFMSPNTLPCRSLNNAIFTKGQGERMRNTIASNPIFNEVKGIGSSCIENLQISKAIYGNNVQAKTAKNTITAVNTIHANAAVTYDASSRILLKSGFRAVAGSRFLAYIDGCSSSNVNRGSNSKTLNSLNKAHSKTLKDEVIVYPNPFDSMLIISSNKNVDNWKLMDINNSIIKVGTTKNINASSINKGVYILKITFKDGTIISKKIIKLWNLKI